MKSLIVFSFLAVFVFTHKLSYSAPVVEPIALVKSEVLVAENDEFDEIGTADDATSKKKKKKRVKRDSSVEISGVVEYKEEEKQEGPGQSIFYKTGIGISQSAFVGTNLLQTMNMVQNAMANLNGGAFPANQFNAIPGAIPSLTYWTDTRSAWDLGLYLSYIPGNDFEDVAVKVEYGGSMLTTLQIRKLSRLLSKENFYIYWGIPFGVLALTGRTGTVKTAAGVKTGEVIQGTRFGVGTGGVLGTEVSFLTCNCFLKNLSLSFELGAYARYFSGVSDNLALNGQATKYSGGLEINTTADGGISRFLTVGAGLHYYLY